MDSNANGISVKGRDAVEFHVNVRVDIAELSGWSTDQIQAFFGGITQILAAKAAEGEET